jgi:hypothetical protein
MVNASASSDAIKGGIPLDETSIDPRFRSLDGMFFVVGAQKSGTTWLHWYLARHPDVCLPVKKETNYWVSFEYGTERFIKRNKKWIREARTAWLKGLPRRLLFIGKAMQAKRLRSAKGVARAHANARRPHRHYADVLFQVRQPRTRVAGEICPQYAALKPETYVEMASLAQRVKFVFIMRDPLARTISSVKHGIRYEHGSRHDLDEAQLAAAVEKSLKGNTGWGLAKSRYHTTLSNLEKAIPAEDIHIMFYERMFCDAEIARLNAFLGISDHPANFEKRVNVDIHPGVEVDAANERRLLLALGDVYDALAVRFGDRLPDNWQARIAQLQEARVAHV